MSKSLLESAAEILSTTLGKDKEPMKKTAADVVDVGGETPTTPPTEDMGAAASSTITPAAKPATKGDAKSVKTQANEEAESEDAEVISEEDEIELTEEEIDAYLDSLSEEELAELVAEAEQIDEMGSVQLALNKGVKAPLKKGATLANPKMAEETMTEEEIVEARKAAVKKMVADNMGSCKEDVDALFNGESLSEEFRTKATTIFEAAVRARVEAIAEQVVAENEKTLEESFNDLQEDMSIQVDEYLNYVVENWMEENKLAVETGLRAELAEDFISGLKNLFTEHYIEMPEEKADLVEEMAAAVVAAEEKLAEQAEVLAATAKALNESKAIEILRKTCVGLTETQVAKIKALAEGVEFTTEGEYTDKLAVIRENYFPSKIVKGEAPQTVVETSEEPVVSNDVMSQYVKAITKQLPK